MKTTYQSTLEITRISEIDQLINDRKFAEALRLISRKEENFNNLKKKAVILDCLERYEEALEFFNRALAINCDDEIKILKAGTLYRYAKILFFPKSQYQNALNLTDEALKILPESEDASEFHFLRAEILEAMEDLVEAQKSYLIAHKEFDRLDEFEKQLEYIRSTEDIIINITGGHFYNFTAENSLIVDLKKEEDNEYDSDAIAVYLDGEKIGYVANSDYTVMEGAKSASEIKNMIESDGKAEILFDYLGSYTVARII